MTTAAYIAKLTNNIEDHSVQMAVVDYTGMYDADGFIDMKADLNRRFGTRCMAHVKVYGFKVLALNKRAREAK